jgi:hypothetical protein
MIEKWKMYRDERGHAGAILMDLSKAFDAIKHKLLIAKLQAYGFSNDALEIVQAYLKGRWQRTKINTSFSTWAEILCGTFQGTVLGPKFFNIFINDLFYLLRIQMCAILLTIQHHTHATLTYPFFSTTWKVMQLLQYRGLMQIA